ncbi:hypothetical protein G7054_g1076 [Neopestalotiopsis clavispora]|nr:hypothetical protein G7054_g1076 [Neopestalotiopsis clavispora]
MAPKPEDEDEDFTRPPDSSDSEDDRQRTADIVPTKFKPGATSARSSTGSTQSKESRPLTNNAVQKESESQPLTGIKRSGDDMASHLTDARGFSKKAKVRTTFGKSSKPAIRVPNRNYSKKDPESSDKAFKHHSVASSPESSPVKSKFKRLESLEFSPEKEKKGFIKPSLLSDDDSPPPTRTLKRSRSSKKKGRDGKDSAKENEEPEETTPKRKFKMHFLDDLDDLKDMSDGESRAPLNTQQVKRLLDPESVGLESDSELSSVDEDEVVGFEARCPMCDDLVDPILLKQYTSNGKMNVKKQTAFCRMHKRKDAEVVQRTKGYPTIDWDNLHVQLAKHEQHTKNILEGKQPSHYATILSERVEAGENRTLLRTEESLIPGYYGPRGLRVMTDYIMKRFSDTVRKRAIEDRLVSSRGYTGYVQAVLVPEMAVCLIKEDMRVDEDEARQILSDSRDIGELVNEETKDIVRWTEEERQGE